MRDVWFDAVQNARALPPNRKNLSRAKQAANENKNKVLIRMFKNTTKCASAPLKWGEKHCNESGTSQPQ
jgi:hypothetical protein